MLREHGKRLVYVWKVADMAIFLALFVGLLLHPWFWQPAGLDEGAGLRRIVILALATAIAWPIILSHFGVYESLRRESLWGLLARLAGASGLGALILATTAFVLGAPVAPAFPLAFAAATFIAQSSLRIPAFHILRILRRSGRNYRNVVIVGAGPRARGVQETVDSHPEWGLRIISFLDEPSGDFTPSVPIEKIQKIIDLPQILRDSTVDEVLVACPRQMLPSLVPVVRECSLIGVPVTLLTDIFDSELPAPRAGKFASFGTLSFAPVHHDPIQLTIKRGIDIVGAGVGLLLSAPAIAAAALAIKLTSRGPVFFWHIRCGLNGHRFMMPKLRTMHEDAEARKADLMHLNEMDGPVFKITDDPRVTPVGRVLRKLSIDELPQFWSVLRGDMSLVGPRPPTPDEVVQYCGSHRRRLSMRPGLTCLWQVSGRNEIAFQEWMNLDLEYIDTWSLGKDLGILLRTIPTVLLARGAS
jgi:exopolysaccharide biosynthesis polyprenyl glycosylphosphotransferase